MASQANKLSDKLFNTGALQSIIDNCAVTFVYEFINAPSTECPNVNPLPFAWIEEGEDGPEANKEAGASTTPTTSVKGDKTGVKVDNAGNVYMPQTNVLGMTLGGYPVSGKTVLRGTMLSNGSFVTGEAQQKAAKDKMPGKVGNVDGTSPEEDPATAEMRANWEAMKQYEHSWGDAGCPICGMYKV